MRINRRRLLILREEGMSTDELRTRIIAKAARLQEDVLNSFIDCCHLASGDGTGENPCTDLEAAIDLHRSRSGYD